MTSTIVDLAEYAKAKGYLNVQKYVLQPDPDACIALRGYGGAPGERAFGSAKFVRSNGRVQVVVRGAPYDTQEPETRALALWADLQLQGATVNGSFYHEVTPLQEPFPLRQDENKRWEWVFNVQTKKPV